MSLLSLENVSFGYHDQQLIFENISFIYSKHTQNKLVLNVNFKGF